MPIATTVIVYILTISPHDMFRQPSYNCIKCVYIIYLYYADFVLYSNHKINKTNFKFTHLKFCFATGRYGFICKWKLKFVFIIRCDMYRAYPPSPKCPNYFHFLYIFLQVWAFTSLLMISCATLWPWPHFFVTMVSPETPSLRRWWMHFLTWLAQICRTTLRVSGIHRRLNEDYFHRNYIISRGRR